MILFLSRLFFFYLLGLLAFDELYFFDDESDNDWSGSGSPGMCDLPFCSGISVGRVNGVGSGIFVPTGTE